MARRETPIAIYAGLLTTPRHIVAVTGTHSRKLSMKQLTRLLPTESAMAYRSPSTSCSVLTK
jgi:hypothetical protein